MYGTGTWAGGNRGRRAGEAGSWLFPVKGIPAHSPRGASTRKTRAWFNGKPSSRPNGRELALPPGGLAFSRGGDACAGERAADPLDGRLSCASSVRPSLFRASRIALLSWVQGPSVLACESRLGSLRTSPKLIPEEWQPPGFDIVYAGFLSGISFPSKNRLLDAISLSGLLGQDQGARVDWRGRSAPRRAVREAVR